MKKKKQAKVETELAISVYNNIIKTCDEISKNLKVFEKEVHERIKEILEE